MARVGWLISDHVISPPGSKLVLDHLVAAAVVARPARGPAPIYRHFSGCSLGQIKTHDCVKSVQGGIIKGLDTGGGKKFRNYYNQSTPVSKGHWVETRAQNKCVLDVQFSSVQSLSHVWLFETPWIAARQASLSITNSRSLLKLMSIESVMPSCHLILYRPLLLLPPIPPSNESSLCMRWPKYWSFSFSISPSNEHPGLICFRMDWLDLLASKGLSRVFPNTKVQNHQFFVTQLSS